MHLTIGNWHALERLERFPGLLPFRLRLPACTRRTDETGMHRQVGSGMGALVGSGCPSLPRDDPHSCVLSDSFQSSAHHLMPSAFHEVSMRTAVSVLASGSFLETQDDKRHRIPTSPEEFCGNETFWQVDATFPSSLAQLRGGQLFLLR